MISGLPSGTKQVFAPHKELEEGWTYVSIQEDNVIIGVKIAITKVLKLVGPDGKPIIDAFGNNAYSFQSSNVVRLLTREEYDSIKGKGKE
jgi:hypothetical protein